MPAWFAAWLKSLTQEQRDELYIYFSENPAAGDEVADIVESD